MEDKLKELELEINGLKLTIQQLVDKVANLESGESQSGVYFDGCPDYATEYIMKTINKKEGE